MNRRQLVASMLALCAISTMSPAADSPWPAKPVRMIAPFPAGGATDTVGRFLGQRLGEKFGQPFIVENRAGAAGNIGTNAVATSAPDGYTLGLPSSGPLITNKFIYKDMPYDAEKNLTPIAFIGEVPLVFVVNPSVPANNLKEFIELARANPGKYSMGNPGRGLPGHLAVELMKMNTRIDLLSVSYKGDAPALTDLLGGTIHSLSSPVTAFIPNIQAGRLRAVAVTSKVRLPALPNVPTAIEQGIDVDTTVLYAMVGPARLPRPIVDKLNAEVNRIFDSPEGKAKLAEFGALPMIGTPEQLGALMKSEAANWKHVIETTNVKVD